MAAPLREQLKNNAVGELDGGIDASQTTLDVVDGSVFPSAGNFRLVIDDELLICTARSTDTLTVVRGQEGTTGASHSNGAICNHVLTEDGLDRWGKDNLPLWGVSSRLPLNKLVNSSGVVIDSSDFTIINQDSTVFTDLEGTIFVNKPANATSTMSHTLLVETGLTPPFTRIMAFQFFGGRTQSSVFQHVGLALRQSSSGKIIGWGKVYESGVKLGGLRYASNTANPDATSSVTRDAVDLSDVLWVKITLSSTQVTYSVSYDGIEWYDRATENDDAYIAGDWDQIGILFSNRNSNDPVHARILHYSTP